MTPEEWQRIRPILESALELDASNRSSFLDGACNDPSMRREVESLLASHEEAGTNLLDAAAVPAFVLEEELKFRLAPGKRVGPYEIAGEIAQGGMGAVYRAVRADGQYKQQVAVKIVRADFGAEFTAARFRNERQILASLDHPNIARILDGGATTEGIPYFVMELIDGLPITDYCDQQKLTVDARLKLFRTVCSAVHYAHQHLVIHRDIKPTNILVTSEGAPKLLDFGIAKILDPKQMPENVTMTGAGFSLMTPEYASPEQFSGAAITTATDVYSLGAVLYELLAGQRAYQFASRMPHDVARAVLETEPEKPSTASYREQGAGEKETPAAPVTPQVISSLRSDTPERLQRRLKGDLDNIVLKALRKEPSARYSSADQLSEDIRRHLEGLPVLARKGSVPYRARKYVLRHKVVVAAAALIFLSLLTGLGLTLREARIARANQLQAERRFNDLRALANSLMFEIHDSIRNLAGATPARKLLVSKALQYLDGLSKETGGDTSLQNELATAYERVGDVQGYPDTPNLGDSAGALASYRKALAIRQSVLDKNRLPENQQTVASDYERIGRTLESQGSYREGLEFIRKGLDIREAVAKGSPDPKAQESLAGAYFLVASGYNQLNDPNSAVDYYRKSAAIRESIASDSPMVQTRLAGTYGFMAPILWRIGNHAEAVSTQQKALAIMTKLSESDPANAIYREYLDEAHYWTAFYQQEGGDFSQALLNYRLALSDFQKLNTADPNEARTKEYLGMCHRSVGQVLTEKAEFAAAIESFHKALLVFDEKSPDYLNHIAYTYELLGNTYSRFAARPNSSRAASLENWREARAAYQKSVDDWLAFNKRGTEDALGPSGLDRIRRKLAECDAALGQAQ